MFICWPMLSGSVLKLDPKAKFIGASFRIGVVNTVNMTNQNNWNLASKVKAKSVNLFYLKYLAVKHLTNKSLQKSR